jgi:hypothetical protein
MQSRLDTPRPHHSVGLGASHTVDYFDARGDVPVPGLAVSEV